MLLSIYLNSIINTITTKSYDYDNSTDESDAMTFHVFKGTQGGFISIHLVSL